MIFIFQDLSYSFKYTKLSDIAFIYLSMTLNSQGFFILGAD